MGDQSTIQWTEATWNPTTGCDRVSPGCANCYAATLAPRLQAMALAKSVKDGMGPFPTDPYMRDGDPKTSGPGFGLMMHESRLDQPLRWTRPRRIFVDSMSDLFHPEVTDAFLDRVFAVMALATQHTFQVLTKRPERMREYLRRWNRADIVWSEARRLVPRLAENVIGEYLLEPDSLWPLPNVWVGTSVENARWRTRIDELRETPAAVRFLSCEPLLGPLASPTKVFVIDDERDAIDRIADALDLTDIGWVIIGGESGPGARPMDEAWVRAIVDECREQGAAPFVKQMGTVWAVEHGYGRTHAGDPSQWPADLRVREYPV